MFSSVQFSSHDPRAPTNRFRRTIFTLHRQFSFLKYSIRQRFLITCRDLSSNVFYDTSLPDGLFDKVPALTRLWVVKMATVYSLCHVYSVDNFKKKFEDALFSNDFYS